MSRTLVDPQKASARGAHAPSWGGRAAREPAAAPRRAQDPPPAADAGARAVDPQQIDLELIWFTRACLCNVVKLERAIADCEAAGEEQLESLFRRAQAESRRGAEFGKALLAQRLADRT